MSVALERPIVWQNGYPTADGRPFAEGDVHRQVMMLLIKALEDWYEEDKKVYVSGNILVYYEEGSKRKRLAPDVFVVKGVRKHMRPNYLLWEEGRAPNIAIEVTSSSMRKEDTVKKFALYQDVLKIPEYFLFDPFGDYLNPRLQGYRRVDGKYKPIRIRNGQVRSRQLGLLLRTEGEYLRLVDPGTGKRIPTCEESIRESQQARLRIQAETACIQADTARIRAEIAALRKRSLGRNVTLAK